MESGSEILRIGDFTMRVRKPAGRGPFPLLVLLHGWTGDEDAMWVFTRRFPADWMLIAPRGLYPTPLGGYSWHDQTVGAWPTVRHFAPAVQALDELLQPQNFPQVDFKMPLRMVGFSQGAALTFTYALQRPERVGSLAGLAGFLPDGAAGLAEERPLQGKPIFLAHGTRDELVPVERGREAVRILQLAGAQVHYCEDEVGHKLSAACYDSLGAFFARH